MNLVFGTTRETASQLAERTSQEIAGIQGNA
jgi:hypothetical protein